MRYISPVVIVVAVLIAPASLVFAQVMKYTDAQGVTHFVGSFEQVPAQYRSGATEPKMAPATAVDDGGVEKSCFKKWDKLRTFQEKQWQGSGVRMGSVTSTLDLYDNMYPECRHVGRNWKQN